MEHCLRYPSDMGIDRVPKSFLFGFLILITFVCNCSVSSPTGQKLLRLELIREGKPILITLFDAPDNSNGNEIWEKAGEVPFATEFVADAIHPTEGSPLEAVLEGHFRVLITHVETTQVSCSVESPRLVRSDEARKDWRLDPSEIQGILDRVHQCER
mgnify:CR=1 FL=1